MTGRSWIFGLEGILSLERFIGLLFANLIEALMQRHLGSTPASTLSRPAALDEKLYTTS
jgi:hypothetical protein